MKVVPLASPGGHLQPTWFRVAGTGSGHYNWVMKYLLFLATLTLLVSSCAPRYGYRGYRQPGCASGYGYAQRNVGYGPGWQAYHQRQASRAAAGVPRSPR